jgi:hypothetical protein
MIADRLGQEFKILWNREDIKRYFNYEKYDYSLCQPNDAPKRDFNLIDRYSKEDIEICPVVSPENFPESTHTKFYVNREISYYLYKKEPFSSRSYLQDIYAVYKSLYTDIFVPTELVLSRVQTYFPDAKETVIGIQIRTGDIYMDTYWNSYKVFDSPESILPGILSKIKEHLDLDYKVYKVFLTSDHSKIYDLALKIWPSESLIYIDERIQHMDRSPEGDFSKILVDNYILSQKTSRLYISECSNYGRVAALSSVHDSIFGLDCKPLVKHTLLCKHPLSMNLT